jgi:kynureninase
MSSQSSAAASIAAARERAQGLDREDPLAFTRSEFNIPTKAQIASTRLPDPGATARVLGDS